MFFFSSLFWPNLNEIESTAKQPPMVVVDKKKEDATIVKDENDDKVEPAPKAIITIYGFEKEGDYPSYNRGCVDSPYVARVEAFCRLYNIPYIKESAKPFENPKSEFA